MREIKKGDVVSRNSYKNDIMFYVKKIMKLTDGRKIAILKGIDVRVEADAPVEDLQIVSKEEQMRREKEFEEKNHMQGLMFKMDNDPRITKVGRFIRKFSIDELPQFYNVLRGDMSLVGTRPPTLDEFEQYSSHHKRRLSMRPGITGLWQVSGRSQIEDFEEVVRLDCQYIDNWSPSLDIKILFKTLGVVFTGHGAQ